MKKLLSVLWFCGMIFVSSLYAETPVDFSAKGKAYMLLDGKISSNWSLSEQKLIKVKYTKEPISKVLPTALNCFSAFVKRAFSVVTFR